MSAKRACRSLLAATAGTIIAFTMTTTPAAAAPLLPDWPDDMPRPAEVAAAQALADKAAVDDAVAYAVASGLLIGADEEAGLVEPGSVDVVDAVAPEKKSELLAWPTDRQTLGSPFGMRFHPILHYWRMHTGVDFGIGCGTPVYASESGTVLATGNSGGYGNRIVVKHGDRGINTTYNHLSSIGVKSGQNVTRGQVIGKIGSTGLSTGCHLHFEVMVNGSYTDPAPYLTGKKSTARLTVPAGALMPQGGGKKPATPAKPSASTPAKPSPSTKPSPSAPAPTKPAPTSPAPTAPPPSKPEPTTPPAPSPTTPPPAPAPTTPPPPPPAPSPEPTTPPAPSPSEPPPSDPAPSPDPTDPPGDSGSETSAP